MTNLCYKLLLVMLLTCISNLGYGQANEIKIKFIGNCGLYLTDGNANIYIDFPYKSGAHNYMEYDKSEIDHIKADATFIFTHKHADHYSRRLAAKCTGKKYGPWNISEIESLKEAIPNFAIEAFKTKHKVFGISFEHYSYLIIWHGKRIFISGDTESADTVAKVKNLNWLFAPVWLLTDAKEKKIKIDAEMYAVYHIGPKDSITSTDPKIILMNTSGQMLNIPFE